jgi:hypothetical protein
MPEPVAERPHIRDYGIPDSTEGLLAWSDVVARLEQATVYWLASTTPDGAPHVIPIWGAWHDGAWYCDGGPQARHNRNFARNPKASIHLEDGTRAVIVEGKVGTFHPVPPEIGAALSAEYTAKYRAAGYTPGPDAWDAGGLYRLLPERAFAWNLFPKDATRFRFQ